MYAPKGPISLLLASLALAACQPPAGDPTEDGSSEEGGPDDDDGKTPEEDSEGAPDDDSMSSETEGGGFVCGDVPLTEDGAIRLDEANNYAFGSTLSVSSTRVASRSELQFDWSNLTIDFIGHEVDPLTDINLISLILWNIPYSELLQRINDDDLDQNAFVVLATFLPDGTSTTASVLDFTLFGTPIPEEQLFGYLDGEMYPPETHTHTLMAASGTEPGQGTRMIGLIEPTADEENVVVSLGPDSTELEYTANLTDLEPLKLPAITPDTAIDWSEMTTNGLGNPFEQGFITDVMIARYDLTPDELEAQFLDIELIATEIYRGEVLFGDDVLLSELTDGAGMPFTGITDDGTWALALTCGACRNPAPWFMTVLESCEE